MGVPTHGEVFSKLIYHIDEARNQAATISHLHQTEDSNKDKLLAKGWLAIEEQLHRFRHIVTLMAQGRLQ